MSFEKELQKRSDLPCELCGSNNANLMQYHQALVTRLNIIFEFAPPANSK